MDRKTLSIINDTAKSIVSSCDEALGAPSDLLDVIKEIKENAEFIEEKTRGNNG